MLPSTIPRNTYVGNGTTGTYAWSWLIDEASDLHVAALTANPETIVPLTLDVDYTIQTPATQVGSVSGGNIVLTNTGYFAFSNGILPAGYALVLRRTVTFDQSAEFANQGAFNPGDYESALDYLGEQIQQLQDALSRCLQTPLDDFSAPVSNIGPAQVRALGFVCFDQNGNVKTALAVSTFTPSDIGALVTPAVGKADLGNTAACYLNYTLPIASSDGVTYSWTSTFNVYGGMLATVIWPETNTSTAPMLKTGFSFPINPGTLDQPIVNKDGSSPSIGQLVAGTASLLFYDGAKWRVMA